MRISDRGVSQARHLSERDARTTARGWCRWPGSRCRRCTLTLLLRGNGYAVRHRLLAPARRICGVYLHLCCRLSPPGSRLHDIGAFWLVSHRFRPVIIRRRLARFAVPCDFYEHSERNTINRGYFERHRTHYCRFFGNVNMALLVLNTSFAAILATCSF